MIGARKGFLVSNIDTYFTTKGHVYEIIEYEDLGEYYIIRFIGDDDELSSTLLKSKKYNFDYDIYWQTL